MQPKYPVYIVSHKRWDTRRTMKELTRLKIPYKVVIEPDDLETYSMTPDKDNLLVVPEKYHDEYENCDYLGRTKSQGPGPARNFAWDHSIEQGAEWHWVMDDNIARFYRMNRNLRKCVLDGTMFKVMEDFCERYTNLSMAGPNYSMFVPRKAFRLPLCMNTRIYSCNLIKNDIPFRWRGRYNEDTDLSLRILKKGDCTCQFNAFLQDKAPTQTVHGGNDEEFYSQEGTWPKSKMQVQLHPDVSSMVWKFNRWHHYVDYTPFKKNRLILKDGVVVKKEIDNYNMILKKNPHFEADK